MNYLVKYLNGPNDLTRIKIDLTDFGLAGQHSKGGTPIFASPECFGNKTHKSDIFSLGRVLHFVMSPKEDFLEWLFVPVTSPAEKVAIMRSVNGNDLLKLISKMTQVQNSNRIAVDEVRREFNRLRKVDGHRID